VTAGPFVLIKDRGPLLPAAEGPDLFNAFFAARPHKRHLLLELFEIFVYN